VRHLRSLFEGPISVIGSWVTLGIFVFMGTLYRSRDVEYWIQEWRRGETDYHAFVRHCRRVVPEDAILWIVREPPPDVDTNFVLFSRLYPRQSRECRLEDLPSIRKRDPSAWMIFITDPFDSKTAYVGRVAHFR